MEKKFYQSNDGRAYFLEEIYHNTTLLKKTKDLADEISRKNKVFNLTLVVVMEGAAYFSSNLIAALPECVKVNVELIGVHSYTGTESGEMLFKDFKFRQTLNNKHVVIVDDIIDTGKTIFEIKKRIETIFPSTRSIQTATLLNKPNRVIEIEPNYFGLEVQKDDFVVGHGIDFENRHRNEFNLYRVKFLEN